MEDEKYENPILEEMGEENGMSGTLLKWVALVTMFIDHAAVALAPAYGNVYWCMRFIGRLAFPLYCFLIVEGFCHTRSVGRYLGRLAVFGLISEIPFNLLLTGHFFSLRYQNVYFTLFLGLAALWGYKKMADRHLWPLGLVWCVVLAFLAEILRADYGATGAALIWLLYFFRRWKLPRTLIGYFVLMAGAGDAEGTALISFILMDFYNGKRGGGKVPSWFFYAFYPVHIVLLCVIRAVIRL